MLMSSIAKLFGPKTRFLGLINLIGKKPPKRLKSGCYFPMQKLEKILPKRSSVVTWPVISPK